MGYQETHRFRPVGLVTHPPKTQGCGFGFWEVQVPTNGYPNPRVCTRAQPYTLQFLPSIMARGKGVSAGVWVTVGNPNLSHYKQTKQLHPSGQWQHMESANHRRAQDIRSMLPPLQPTLHSCHHLHTSDMSWKDHEEYLAMECEEHGGGGSQMYMEDAMNNAPPGEEGHEISHAGGDHEGFHNVIWDLSKMGLGSW